VSKELTFIVTGASAVQIVILNDGLERRMTPFAKGFGGLNIVVPVNEERGQAFGVLPGCIDDRMPLRGHDSNALQTNAMQVRCQPRSAPANVTSMPGLVANAGEPDEFLELCNKAWAMAARISDGVKRFHDA